MQELAPPVMTRSAAPREMMRNASPIAWVLAEQPLVMVLLGPCASYMMATCEASMLGSCFNSQRGKRFWIPSAPNRTRSNWPSFPRDCLMAGPSSHGSVEIMLAPKTTPTRSGSGAEAPRPASEAASRAAATANCMSRIITLSDFFFSMYLCGSNPFTSAAILVGNPRVSKRVMRETPDLRAVRLVQNSSRLRPRGLITPIPVMTTLRLSWIMALRRPAPGRPRGGACGIRRGTKESRATERRAPGSMKNPRAFRRRCQHAMRPPRKGDAALCA